MGQVFLCHDTNLDVDVAIKVLPPDVAADEHALEEIRKEARVSAKLRECPGIIVLYGFETHGETSYLVMEFAPGRSLRDRLKERKVLPEKECRKIGLEILRALAHAHQRKVLHRDIKPANVLFDRSGRAKVADFGLAKVLAETSTRKSLRQVAGTPSYIPPEVIRQKQADGRADLYSLGCMLYEMAVGEPPFEGSITEVLTAKLAAADTAPDPRAARPELSEAFAAVVMKLIALEPGDRYRDAETAFKALRGTVSAAGAQEDSVPDLPPPRRSRMLILAAVGAVVALLVAGLAFAILGGGNGTEPAQEPLAGGTGAPPAEPPTEPPVELTGVEPPDVEAGVEPGEAPEPPPPTVVTGILVLTDPPGARVSVDGVDRGVAGEEGLLLTDLASGIPMTISLTHRMCQPSEKTGVVWTEGERKELRLTLVRKGGELYLEKGVPGAAVMAKREGAAPRDLTLAQDGSLGPVWFEFGTYELIISKRGYHTRSQMVRVEVGKKTTIDAGLVEKDGLLTVHSEPTGAKVYAGETLLGTTPLEKLEIRPGRYEIRLDHPGRDLHVLPGEIEVRGERHVDLGTAILPPLAILDLAGLPEGVTALIDGEPVSGTLELRSGAVKIVLEREKHRPQSIEVILISGEVTVPHVGEWELNPGHLDLTGLPEGVDVLVDGRLVDGTSAPVEVSAGPHRVDLYRKDYRPVRREVSVEPEATVVPSVSRWVRKMYRPLIRNLAPPPERDLTGTALPQGILLRERRIYWEKDDAEMVVVPAGEFVMGSDSAGGSERPAHRVFVSAFLMDRHEVTNEQFERFIKETDHSTYAEGRSWGDWRHPGGRGTSFRGKERHPVVHISYGDAAAYAKWAGKRLPTEAEFEKALRGGHAGRIYPWGDEKPEGWIGNLPDRSLSTSVPRFEEYDDGSEDGTVVGTYEPNGFGLFDLSGNVSEWCSDWFGAYPKGTQKDPRGPAKGTLNITRGGSWAEKADDCRCAARIQRRKNFHSIYTGFRCVVSLPR
jgi:formylglycine-generating enzyme required for sulfatase activity